MARVQYGGQIAARQVVVITVVVEYSQELGRWRRNTYENGRLVAAQDTEEPPGGQPSTATLTVIPTPSKTTSVATTSAATTSAATTSAATTGTDPNDPNGPNGTDPNDPNGTDPNDPNNTDPNSTDPNNTDPNSTDPNSTDPNSTETSGAETTGTETSTAEPTSSGSIASALPFDSNANLVEGTQEQITGICRISNLDATGNINLSGAPFTCEPLIPANQQGQPVNQIPAIAAAAVLGVLFAAAAGLLVFFLLRQRKRHNHEPDTAINHSYPLKAHDMSNGTPDQVSTLQSQLAAERRRVNDLQASLLAQSSTPVGWSTAAPKDDRDLKRSFLELFNEIKGLAGNYYRSKQAIGPQELSAEIKDILNECVDGWDSMLGDAKGRMLLVRVVCGEVLRRAWDDGEFLGKRIGKGFRVMEKEAVKGLTTQQAHLWRVQTLGPLISTIDPKTRAEAVTAIATRINALLGPFFPPGSHQNPTQYTESIVTRAASLYFDLATQNAFYSLQPYISVSRPDASEDSAIFEAGSCDDVEQKFETGRDEAGREWSQADGARIRGFVFPAVVKYGDGRGSGWDAAVVVVFKAQVFM